jgi:hypothetical protein
MAEILGHYDAAAIHSFLAEAEVLRGLSEKGFGQFEVVIEAAGRVLPHIQLFGCKRSGRHLLLDACVGEAVVRPAFFTRRGSTMERAIDLAVVHWVREEDPTMAFRSDRPPLPIQQHPGLGVLRRAFRVVVRMAGELNKDGVASVPKFFHDAVIFFRSRLFLFLDGREQGRFEALLRDLRSLPLGEASLALASDCVRDARGRAAHWTPGYQVFPISSLVTTYFHSPEYAAEVSRALTEEQFSCDRDLLRRTCEALRSLRSAGTT